jgi:hypothetical protein
VGGCGGCKKGMSEAALGPMIQAPRILSMSLSLMSFTCGQRRGVLGKGGGRWGVELVME